MFQRLGQMVLKPQCKGIRRVRVNALRVQLNRFLAFVQRGSCQRQVMMVLKAIGRPFRHEARPFVRDLLTPDVLRRRGLFKPAAVAKLLDEHESGFADHGSQIWALINLELWQRLFIDAPVRAPEAAAFLS